VIWIPSDSFESYSESSEKLSATLFIVTFTLYWRFWKWGKDPVSRSVSIMQMTTTVSIAVLTFFQFSNFPHSGGAGEQDVREVLFSL
jgi:hypothetical protein